MMRIKSFFVKSVDDAIAQAREQLGTEALLLNTRKLPPEPGKPAGYEVVFGVVDEETSTAAEPVEARAELIWSKAVLAQAEPEPIPSPAEPAPALQPSLSADPSGQDDPAAELARLQAQIAEIRRLIARCSRRPMRLGRSVPELADVCANLIASDVDAALSQDIVARLESTLASEAFFEHMAGGPPEGSADSRPVSLRRLDEMVREEMTRRVGIDARLGVEGSPGAAVAFVGPPGAGKTTNLVKLAAAVRVAGQPVRVVALDGSHSALQSLAADFRIPFAKVPSADALPAIVSEARRREIVLIDTAGYAPEDIREQAPVAALERCGEIDIHLVVAASAPAAELRRMIERYEVYRPSKVLATKLDQAFSLGRVFSEAARARLSLSFVANGASVPGDIRPASVEDLTSLAASRRKAHAQRVA